MSFQACFGTVVDVVVVVVGMDMSCCFEESFCVASSSVDDIVVG